VDRAPDFEELDAGMRAAMGKSEDVLEIGKEDFPIPGLERRIREIERELMDGRGFVLLRGVRRADGKSAEGALRSLLLKLLAHLAVANGDLDGDGHCASGSRIPAERFLKDRVGRRVYDARQYGDLPR
jgi:hypothetical protein